MCSGGKSGARYLVWRVFLGLQSGIEGSPGSAIWYRGSPGPAIWSPKSIEPLVNLKTWSKEQERNPDKRKEQMMIDRLDCSGFPQGGPSQFGPHQGSSKGVNFALNGAR